VKTYFIKGRLVFSSAFYNKNLSLIWLSNSRVSPINLEIQTFNKVMILKSVYFLLASFRVIIF
jgi:hypothetical protein